MSARSGPRRAVVWSKPMVVDGRSQHLLRLDCGHHVLRFARKAHANCGHCAEVYAKAGLTDMQIRYGKQVI